MDEKTGREYNAAIIYGSTGNSIYSISYKTDR